MHKRLILTKALPKTHRKKIQAIFGEALPSNSFLSQLYIIFTWIQTLVTTLSLDLILTAKRLNNLLLEGERSFK